MRIAVGFITVFIGLYLAGPLSLAAQDEPKQPSAEDIVRRVREHYSRLTDYHFEHQLTATVEAPGKETEQAATVDFELAVAGAERFDGDANASIFPISTKRCRMSAHSEHYSMVLVANDEEAVLYVPHLKQFKRAASSMRAIGGPTSATFFLLVNTFPTATLVDAPFEQPQLLREETLRIADREVRCHVVEAQIQRKRRIPEAPDDEGPSKGAATASLMGSGYLLFLGTHGLSEPKAPAGAAPPADAKPQAITMRLWIDQREPFVWKSELREPLAAPDEAQAPRTLVITDRYTKIQTKGPLPDELFRFEIVEGTQEVEKIGQP